MNKSRWFLKTGLARLGSTRWQKTVAIAHWGDIGKYGRVVAWAEAQPVDFQECNIESNTMDAIRGALPLVDELASVQYRPNPLMLVEVESAWLARTNGLGDATRFIYVANNHVIGPYIRANGTRLDNDKRALRTATSTLDAASRQESSTLHVSFAVPLLEAGENFGHFLFSHLPKLRHWTRNTGYEMTGPTILISGGFAWQYELLQLLKVPPSKICVVNDEIRAISVDRLCVVDEKYFGGREPSFCIENLNWVKRLLADNQISDNYGSSAAQNDIIGLEREPTARRIVLNAAEVRNLIAEFGGRTVQPVRLTIKQQRQEINMSSVIICSNGTEALVTCLVSGRTVVAAIPPGPHFHGIIPAAILASGNNFVPVFCHNSFDPREPADLRDMVVPIDTMREVIMGLVNV